MEKYLLWGTGKRAECYISHLQHPFQADRFKIEAFIDNNNSKAGTEFYGIPVISPKDINNMDYDYISICSTYEKEIKEQIINDLNIPENKIKNIYFDLLDALYKKYKGTTDIEIKEILDKFNKTGFPGIYSFEYETLPKNYELYYDEEKSLYYVIFENKRMYMKRGFSGFTVKDGKKIIDDIWGEQDKNSPHRYEKGDISVHKGDVLIDCGVCEGNFSLHNIEKVSKVYLIECDPEWMEALKYTFAPYKDKVVFCGKFLSNKDSEKTITLDSLVKEKVDFIKMDIEGEEINALDGAKRLLGESSGLRCSICSYHRHGDEDLIKKIFSSYGMEFSTSDGYMLFLPDEDIWINPELRRGIVRGKKE